MDADYFRGLFDYTFWAHRRVWDCVMALSDEQFTRPSDYSIGSIHQQVVHTMSAEWVWLERLHGISPEGFLKIEDYPTREAVRARWDTIEADWRSYLNGLTDEQLKQNIAYVSISGRAQRETHLWQILPHIVNHGTDHRAQILALIYQVGGKTIDQDLIVYSWEL